MCMLRIYKSPNFTSVSLPAMIHSHRMLTRCHSPNSADLVSFSLNRYVHCISYQSDPSQVLKYLCSRKPYCTNLASPLHDVYNPISTPSISSNVSSPNVCIYNPSICIWLTICSSVPWGYKLQSQKCGY